MSKSKVVTPMATGLEQSRFGSTAATSSKCLRCRQWRGKEPCIPNKRRDACKACDKAFKIHPSDSAFDSLAGQKLLDLQNWYAVCANYAAEAPAEDLLSRIAVEINGSTTREQFVAPQADISNADLKNHVTHSKTNLEATSADDNFFKLLWIGSSDLIQQSIDMEVMDEDIEQYILSCINSDEPRSKLLGSAPAKSNSGRGPHVILGIYIMDEYIEETPGGVKQSRHVPGDISQEHFSITLEVPSVEGSDASKDKDSHHEAGKPAANLRQLDDLVKRGVLGRFLNVLWPAHVTHLEKRILDNTQLFVGYLYMLHNLASIVIIDQLRLDERWSTSKVAAALTYSLAFRAQELFKLIMSDCDLIQKDTGRDTQSRAVLDAMEMLYHLFKAPFNRSWLISPEECGEPLIKLRSQLFRNSFKLVSKILCYECFCLNKAKPQWSSITAHLLSSLKDTSANGKNLFPQHFSIAVQEPFDGAVPRHQFWGPFELVIEIQPIVRIPHTEPDGVLKASGVRAQSAQQDTLTRFDFGNAPVMPSLLVGFNDEVQDEVGDLYCQDSFLFHPEYAPPLNADDAKRFRDSGTLGPALDHVPALEKAKTEEPDGEDVDEDQIFADNVGSPVLTDNDLYTGLQANLEWLEENEWTMGKWS